MSKDLTASCEDLVANGEKNLLGLYTSVQKSIDNDSMSNENEDERWRGVTNCVVKLFEKNEVASYRQNVCLTINGNNNKNLNGKLKTKWDLGETSNCQKIKVYPLINRLPSERFKFIAPGDHVYEEVAVVEMSEIDDKPYDLIDYYRNYNPITAKSLINSLCLPRQKICKQCARCVDDPIYSNRLVIGNKFLKAKEAVLLEIGKSVIFKYKESCSAKILTDNYCGESDFMPVCSLVKTRVSGISYSNVSLQETFDLKSSLLPNILLLNNKDNFKSNVSLYHRFYGNLSRISVIRTKPIAFQFDVKDLSLTTTSKKKESNVSNWINKLEKAVKLKQDDSSLIVKEHPNSSSLLLLEPLLTDNDNNYTVANKPRSSNDENLKHRPDHLMIIRLLIAYTITFFILAFITFYIIFFT